MSPHVHIGEANALRERVDQLERECQRLREINSLLLDDCAAMRARMAKACDVLSVQAATR